MKFELFAQITSVFAGLFIVGTLACLPLYKWNARQFFASRLWTKIYWWVPIFAVLCTILARGAEVAIPVVILLLLQAGREFLRQQAWRYVVTALYVVLFCISLCALMAITLLPTAVAVHGLISVCFASVLSDVLAFFAGSYLGRHHLPNWINPKKSWEGVSGQIAGSFAGLGLIALLPAIGFSWRLALAVGVASAGGDLINSVAKRKVGIKDWSNAIPGHGGVLDRFSSLSFALAAGYVLLR